MLSVSTLQKGEFEINDVCLSIPCIVSKGGIRKIIQSPLTAEELVQLHHSAGILRKSIDDLEYEK